MAEAFAESFGAKGVKAYSAGSHPKGKVNPQAIQVMQEKGLDLSRKNSKSIQDLPEKSFDYVVTMGCGEECPFIPSKATLSWEIPDPKGKDLDVFREVRDLIGQKVGNLLEEIKSSRGS